MKEWLAEELKRSLKESQVGKAHRSAVIKAFNAKYKSEGVQITVGRLSRLYINAGGGMKGFIRSTLAAKRKAEKAAARASIQVQPSPQREQRKEQPVPAIPAPTKKAKAPPKPSASKSRPAPAAPMRHPDLIAARTGGARSEDPWLNARRLRPSEISSEMKGQIADAFVEWSAEEHRRIAFKRAAAFAAARVNARRTKPEDPIVNATAIEDMIGDREDLKDWLVKQPSFIKRFAHPAEKAASVMALVRPFEGE
jgi:hypothetical protein